MLARQALESYPFPLVQHYLEKEGNAEVQTVRLGKISNYCSYILRKLGRSQEKVLRREWWLRICSIPRSVKVTPEWNTGEL